VAGQLIVSISGISEQTLPDVAVFCAQLEERAVPSSFLVAPRLKGGYRLDRDGSTVEWLVARRNRGDAIVLHGFDEAARPRSAAANSRRCPPMKRICG
jgi:predicted deacetylase